MQTILAIILSVLATILVSRHYFLRTVKKSLAVYRLLDSLVFQGIAPDVRGQLHFLFRDKEVTDLQQIVLLVANDGQRAISGVMEPLSFTIPGNTEVLDASILYRQPKPLKAQISHSKQAGGETLVQLRFPLLNKGEFFVVKLLLTEKISASDLDFSILADDLPRSLKVQQLPQGAISSSERKIDWASAIAAAVILIVVAWMGYSLLLLWSAKPFLFPYPWASFKFSLESAFLVIPGALLLGFLLLFLLVVVDDAFLGGQLVAIGDPRFPIPREFRDVIFPYRPLWFTSGFGDENDARATRPKTGASASPSPPVPESGADKLPSP